ncbi:uncharacterized protein At4g17910-like [Orussus abietinus]|uniref:uncharacterized protein At4g17910-like n=1 Tax=Orussus abietinus TaxID=222816 RepID=UPI0006251665|nr:uncharacterized protein At4g17910-like [Orussus abietinus]
MITKDDERYRRQQEEFVSNHGGTTAQETIFLIMPNVCSLLLTTTTMGLIGQYLSKNVKTFLEFLLIIVPCILCCTVLSQHVVSVCVTMIMLSLINIFLMRIPIYSLSATEPRPMIGKRPFITIFRALTNVITIICILAVDFKVFPRKLAKTEVYGYSLMDTGVGLFMVANALVAPEARDFGEKPKKYFFRSLLRSLISSLKDSMSLLLLGMSRFIAVEYLQYQRHVTEYGVHWNFFVTLAFVRIFASLITSTISSRYSLLSGIWIIMMHEYTLSNVGLKKWVLSNAPRDNFISANREGLISAPGYVGLYFVGVAVGRLVHATYRSLNENPEARKHQSAVLGILKQSLEIEYNESMVLCIKLSLIAAQACAVTLVCDSYFGVSRRLTNAGYCAWITTLSTAMLTLLLLVEIVSDILIHATVTNKTSSEKDAGKMQKGNDQKFNESECGSIRRIPELFEAVNYNGLAFFLLANLLTGAINMAIRTLYTDNLRAIQVIMVYAAVNMLICVILFRYKVHIKL